MEALFRFTLPTEPTALSALSGAILFTGATHHDHPAVQGWSLPVSKPGDDRSPAWTWVGAGTRQSLLAAMGT